MPLAYMNAYPPTISCSAASLTCRSRCRDGAATLTAQISKPAMNIAVSTTGSMNQRRGFGPDEAAWSVASLDCACGTRFSPKFDTHLSSITIEQYNNRRTNRNFELCSDLC